MATHAKKKKRSIWSLISVLATIVLIGSLACLGVIFFSYWQGQDQYSRLRDQANMKVSDGYDLASMTVDWDALREVNPDVVGWVMVPGTPIDYPIVQGEDNKYYLNHGFNKEENWLAAYGAIFLDATNAPTMTDDCSFLYGHHMRDGSMFAVVDDLTNQDDFDKHRAVYVLTPNGNLRLTSFSVVVTGAEDLIVQTVFGANDAKVAYIQDKMNRSVVECSGPTAEEIAKTNVFAMSTCDYSHGDGRALLFSYVADSTMAGVRGLEQANVSDKLAP